MKVAELLGRVVYDKVEIYDCFGDDSPWVFDGFDGEWNTAEEVPWEAKVADWKVEEEEEKEITGKVRKVKVLRVWLS